MALKSTVFKIQLSVADISRGHYQDYALTLARHPSETDERLACRLIAFALHADENLCFGKGISSEDEPDLWKKSLDGRVENWIELGQPDLKRLRQACSKADEVNIYSYQMGAANHWWQSIKQDVDRFAKLHIGFLKLKSGPSFESLIERNAQLTCTLQDGEVFLSSNSNGEAIGIEVEMVK